MTDLELNGDSDKNQSVCNIQTTENPLQNLKSSFATKSQSLLSKKKNGKLLRIALKAQINLNNTDVREEMSLSDRYKWAWSEVYKGLTKLRQKEIDDSRISGTFGNTDRDKEFLRQVASLAENPSKEASN